MASIIHGIIRSVETSVLYAASAIRQRPVAAGLSLTVAIAFKALNVPFVPIKPLCSYGFSPFDDECDYHENKDEVTECDEGGYRALRIPVNFSPMETSEFFETSIQEKSAKIEDDLTKSGFITNPRRLEQVAGACFGLSLVAAKHLRDRDVEQLSDLINPLQTFEAKFSAATFQKWQPLIFAKSGFAEFFTVMIWDRLIRRGSLAEELWAKEYFSILLEIPEKEISTKYEYFRKEPLHFIDSKTLTDLLHECEGKIVCMGVTDRWGGGHMVLFFSSEGENKHLYFDSGVGIFSFNNRADLVREVPSLFSFPFKLNIVIAIDKVPVRKIA